MIQDVYLLDKSADFKFDHSFDVCAGYTTKSVLVVPLLDSKGEAIGVLQLLNRKKRRL